MGPEERQPDGTVTSVVGSRGAATGTREQEVQPEERSPKRKVRSSTSAEQELARLVAALRADAPLDTADIETARTLGKRKPTPDVAVTIVDIALDRSRSEGDAAHQIARLLAARLTPRDACAALTEALDNKGKTSQRLRVAGSLARRAARAGEAAAPLVARLLRHEDTGVRGAGILVAGRVDPPPVDALIALAQVDEDDELRASATAALVDLLVAQEGDQALRVAVLPTLGRVAREGPASARLAVVSRIHLLGSGGADIALTALHDGGLDDDSLELVALSLIRHGRLAELLQADRSPRVLDIVGELLPEYARMGFDMRPLHEHAAAFLRTPNEDAAACALGALALSGRLDCVEDASLDCGLRKSIRSRALALLVEPRDLPADLHDPAQRRGLRALGRLLDPNATAGDARLNAVQALGSVVPALEDGMRDSVLASLRHVAHEDPSVWVRHAAQRALEGAPEE